MNIQAYPIAITSQKVLKTKGDSSENVIPDSDQEDNLQSPFLKETPTSSSKPLKHIRFSGTNQLCYFPKNGKKDLSPSPTRKSHQSIQSILKNKEKVFFFTQEK
ncbi:unnamed protein product (macronuclear) [Paramecium tetraurelia]|uniref:Uncharacterized protein n=1 Tax=Paramecium tetraurelia TaxID=5888 RepID=A0BFN2_PARTE|nr:uncharacterized protein GSPATT00028384001 [Paramecium tetraurelia]CAK57349.1 unnamed protein product [Paramecium tetraurelia]|eukprot:XP_001424747.1 hypothetical protein (macronuclear) [Paramecium tetraurelia strain d4-2]